MKQLRAVLLAAALIAAGCGGSKPREPGIAPLAPETDEPDRGPRQAPVSLPDYPRDRDLLRFDVQPKTALEYFVDSASIAIVEGGIVRFTVVSRTSAASNVSYEGFRCQTVERIVYAHGRADGSWQMVKEPAWVRVGARETAGFRFPLFWNYLCPRRRTITDVREGVDALRYGGHPDVAVPQGTMTF